MKFEVPIHELGAGDVSACENLGVTLSRLFGLSGNICWLAINHVLGAISASGCTFLSTLLPGRFHAGGLILVGEVRRVRLLIDWLLAPIERIQSQSLAAHQTADPAVLNRYLQAVGNFKIEGVICAAEGEGRSCSWSLLVSVNLPVLLAVNRKGARYSRRCSTLAPVLRVVA